MIVAAQQGPLTVCSLCKASLHVYAVTQCCTAMHSQRHVAPHRHGPAVVTVCLCTQESKFPPPSSAMLMAGASTMAAAAGRASSEELHASAVAAAAAGDDEVGSDAQSTYADAHGRLRAEISTAHKAQGHAEDAMHEAGCGKPTLKLGELSMDGKRSYTARADATRNTLKQRTSMNIRVGSMHVPRGGAALTGSHQGHHHCRRAT
jgi:hypothetical protein